MYRAKSARSGFSDDSRDHETDSAQLELQGSCRTHFSHINIILIQRRSLPKLCERLYSKSYVLSKPKGNGPGPIWN